MYACYFLFMNKKSFYMDKRCGWMYQCFCKGTRDMCHRFWKGLEDFLDSTFIVAQQNGFDLLKCPCKKCKNEYYYDRLIFRNHILLDNF